MIALALLFIVIIGLLWLIFRLLQHFFDTCSSLDEDIFAADLENKLKKQKAIAFYQERNKKINAIISKRLTEMEQKFPSTQTNNEHPGMLTSAFKQVLYSSLHLLRENEYDK